MKKFDKGYIYSKLLSDFIASLVIFFTFFEDFLFDDTVNREKLISTIPYFIIAFVVIYACFIAYRIAYYKTSGYELTETEIKCKRGVFFRKNSVLDYRKIHAINKKQNLFHRIFGIAVLTVDSGSTNTSRQAEIIIVEKSNTVDALLKELNTLKGTGKCNIDNTKEEILLSEKDSLYRFTSKKKMLYTLINILSTAFFTLLFGVLAVSVMAICKLMIKQGFLGTWGEYFLYATLITAGAMLLFSAFSFIGCMIRSFIGYHKFTIKKQGDNIEISFGLLDKHTNTFSYDRIKAVKISQGLVQRMLGFATIKLEVIGYTNESGNDNAELGVLVPFCKYDEINEILGKVLPQYVPDEKQTNSISFFPYVSWFLLFFGIILGLMLAITTAIMLIFSVSLTIIFTVLSSVAGVVLILLVIKLVSAILSYKNNGLTINNGKVTAYSGGFTKSITVLMANNLITMEDVTTPLRKKAGITSIVMHLKTNAHSNEIKVHIQNDAILTELESLLVL